MADVKVLGTQLLDNLEKVIVGKRSALELMVIGLLCEGHILIEDVPGVGKTVMARTLAKSLGCAFSRLQFTPDMLPSDVTGVSVFNQQTRDFEFRRGPIFGQVILADEINRATPKTQAALLEAMDEHQVTVDGVTHLLPRPFMVLATQNPIEYEGTFPLPEAQLDRFLLRIRLGYPGHDEEIAVLEQQQLRHPIETISAICTDQDILSAAEAVRAIYISLPVKRYVVDLTTRTRQVNDAYLGASPRGSLGLARAAQARAALAGRDYVLPDDVKALASSVLSHRIIVNPSARLREVTPERILQEILAEVPVPGGSFAP